MKKFVKVPVQSRNGEAINIYINPLFILKIVPKDENYMTVVYACDAKSTVALCPIEDVVKQLHD